MSEVLLRPYSHESDYDGLRIVLEEAGLFDADYEAPDRLEAISQRYPNMITVAVTGNEIVGSVYLQDGVIPQVNRLAVRANRRRQGIGSLLLATAEAQARELGHNYLELFVSPGRTDARHVYTKRGYTEGHTHVNMYRHIG